MDIGGEIRTVKIYMYIVAEMNLPWYWCFFIFIYVCKIENVVKHVICKNGGLITPILILLLTLPRSLCLRMKSITWLQKLLLMSFFCFCRCQWIVSNPLNFISLSVIYPNYIHPLSFIHFYPTLAWKHLFLAVCKYKNNIYRYSTSSIRQCHVLRRFWGLKSIIPKSCFEKLKTVIK